MAPSFWATYFERLAVVALVLAALYFLVRKLRDARLFRPRAKRLAVVESAMLSPNATVHIVRVDRRYFLIGSGSGGVTRLAELRESSDLDAAQGDEGRSLQR